MNISETVRAYKKAAKNLSVKDYFDYEKSYKKLSRKDKKLSAMITARVARRDLLEKRAKKERKNKLTPDHIAQAILFRSMIKSSRSNELNQFIPVLTKIIDGADIYRDHGFSAPEMIRGLSRMIAQGALR